MLGLRILSGAVCALILAGCDVQQGGLEVTRQAYSVQNPRPEAFFICGDYGCKNRVATGLTQAEWRHVQQPFRTRPRSAGQERRALAEALRRIEVIVGKKTGYDTDGAYSGTLNGESQDCVDEMVNTAVFLALLDQAGHLRFHRQGQRVTIGLMTRRFWTHTVSSIIQTDTGQEFIIDSWAVNFGDLPYVMDRTDWANNAAFRRDF